MSHDRLDPDSDPFKPPAAPTEVHCLHCGKEYESYLIEWRIETGADGAPCGFWCCPTPGCDGRGFGFDILPTDPRYRDERGGWVWDDEDGNGDDEYDEDDDFDEEDYQEEDEAIEFDEEDHAEDPFGEDRAEKDQSEEKGSNGKKPGGSAKEGGGNGDELPW